MTGSRAGYYFRLGGSTSGVLGPGGAGSPGNILEGHTLRSRPGTVDLELWACSPAVCFDEPSVSTALDPRAAIVMMLRKTPPSFEIRVWVLLISFFFSSLLHFEVYA